MKHFTDFHNETFPTAHNAKERYTNFNRAKEFYFTLKWVKYWQCLSLKNCCRTLCRILNLCTFGFLLKKNEDNAVMQSSAELNGQSPSRLIVFLFEMILSGPGVCTLSYLLQFSSWLLVICGSRAGILDHNFLNEWRGTLLCRTNIY